MAKKRSKNKQINLKALALSLGATFGAYVFLLGILAMFGYGVPVVEAISSLYMGYAPTCLGALIGGLYAFFDGAVAGLLIGWLYNRFC